MSPMNNEHQMNVNKKEEQDPEQMTTMMIRAENMYMYI